MNPIPLVSQSHSVITKDSILHQFVMPTCEVPDVPIVSYNQVQPTIKSKETPELVYNTLGNILTKLVDRVDFGNNRWMMKALKVINAEEIVFIVKLWKQKFTLRIDFNLIEGSESTFISVVNIIKKECKDIDLDQLYYPELSKWLYSTSEFPFPSELDCEELSYMLTMIENTKNIHMLKQYVKYLKDICIDLDSLEILSEELKISFKKVIRELLEIQDDTIQRYAIFCIRNKEVISEFKDVADKLDYIIDNTKKWSTYTLAKSVRELI